jgi:hypothetical protein
VGNPQQSCGAPRQISTSPSGHTKQRRFKWAGKHPYVTSPGPLIQVIDYLRNSFPSTMNAQTLKKLGFAPKNEGYIINLLRFLELVDHEGNKTKKAGEVFSLHQDDEFQKEFGAIVKEKYNDLFSLHVEKSWTLDLNSLITFFRQSDQSSGVVGKRQASTFLVLAGMSGHGEVSAPKKHKRTDTTEDIKKTTTKTAKKGKELIKTEINKGDTPSRDFGLTVRIEINLPAEGDQETYDRIFRSIRENLLNV